MAFKDNYKFLQENWGYRTNDGDHDKFEAKIDTPQLRWYQSLTDFIMRYFQQKNIPSYDYEVMDNIELIPRNSLKTYMNLCRSYFLENKDLIEAAHKALKSKGPTVPTGPTGRFLKINLEWMMYISKLSEIDEESFTLTETEFVKKLVEIVKDNLIQFRGSYGSTEMPLMDMLLSINNEDHMYTAPKRRRYISSGSSSSSSSSSSSDSSESDSSESDSEGESDLKSDSTVARSDSEERPRKRKKMDQYLAGEISSDSDIEGEADSILAPVFSTDSDTDEKAESILAEIPNGVSDLQFPKLRL